MIALKELREKVYRKTGMVFTDKELLDAWTKAEEEDNDRSEGRVPLEMLRLADVITGGPPAKNCENCDHEHGGECHFDDDFNGVHIDLRGLRVNSSICCALWENPEMVRLWKVSGEKGVYRSVAKRAGPFSSATALALLPENPANLVQVMAGYVADEDLVPPGREDEPHVTLLSGLPDGSANDVANVVRGFGPIKVVLGTTSLFKNGSEEVLKLDVVSAGLHRLNAMLEKLPHAQTFLGYRPHVTLAYLKPGRGEKYVGMAGAKGQEVTIDKVQFSDTQGRKTVIPLGAVSQAVTVRSGGTCKPGQRADLVGCVPASHIGKAGPRNVLKGRGQPCEQGETASRSGCVPAQGGGQNVPQRPQTGSSRGVRPPAGQDVEGPKTAEGPDEGDALDFSSVSPSPFLETAYGGKRSEFGAASARAVGSALRGLGKVAAHTVAAKQSVGFLAKVSVDMLSNPVRRNLLMAGGMVELLKGHVEEWADKMTDVAAGVAAQHAPGPGTEEAFAEAVSTANAVGAIGAGVFLKNLAEHQPGLHEVAHLGSELVQVIPFATMGYLAFAAVRNPVEVYRAAANVIAGAEGDLEEIAGEAADELEHLL